VNKVIKKVMNKVKKVMYRIETELKLGKGIGLGLGKG
jgi:hypothetical protein